MTGPHFEFRGSGFVDGHVFVDGEPFPWTLYSIAWRLDSETGLPRITFEVEAERITINQNWPDRSGLPEVDVLEVPPGD